MENPTVDHPAGKVPTEDLVKDQKGADPAHPLPSANAVPDTIPGNVEIDAEIEDRFEATDN